MSGRYFKYIIWFNVYHTCLQQRYSFQHIMLPLIVHSGQVKCQETGEYTILKELRNGRENKCLGTVVKGENYGKYIIVLLVYLNIKLTFTSCTSRVKMNIWPLKPQTFLKAKSNSTSFASHCNLFTSILFITTFL